MTSSIGLQAGVARQIISPPKGIYLIGYGDRTKGNIGVHDDLTATALVLSDGQETVAIMALDLLAINEFIVDRIRRQLEPVAVLLCCSHTHSGPITFADEKSPRRNREYIDLLVERVCAAVNLAKQQLVPARLQFARGKADVGINRREKMADGHFEIGRNPRGARDDSLQVVNIFEEREGGHRLATLVNYACHGTVLGPDNLLVSADWIGAMRREVENRLGGLAMFLQGAAANINPDMYWQDERAYDKVNEQGRQVAENVVAVSQTTPIVFQAHPLTLERTVAWLPTEAAVTSSKPPRNYGKELLKMAKLPPFMAIFADALLNQRYPWRSVIEAKDGYWSVPMRINALRIGALGLITYAAETFTEIGLKVKENSPTAYTLFASVSDGCISYLHTASSHPEGGYEVDTAPLAYRYPGRLQAKCENIALEASRGLLENLWQADEPGAQ
ncbi:MAG TPA: neutral/alkaline non-lysosomal ceramidase N-terminal domain-containing protein [Anaerolineaceae bacterium]|nr:neutral/alkaline non-lysosomal ceramidase N-terminal domain-containing protein [Anaerolineaceae bacterium]